MAADAKPINLALQGGGSHGAFTWGVLDAILEDPRVRIEAVSGTSAGAINGVVVADGLVRGGEPGAREALGRFWRKVSEAAEASPLRRLPLDVWMGNWSLDANPAYIMLDLLSRVASPYDLNPAGVNLLRDIIDEMVDFGRVRACDKVKVFVSATNVETGRVKVFRNEQLTADMVMASACLPFLFPAVEIDGVPYWDGGYMGNPALFPFFSGTRCSDVVVVQVNPLVRAGAPRSAKEILNRVNEITFNASLLREFRAIDFVARLLEEGRLDADAYKNVKVHVIDGGDELKRHGSSSKLLAEWDFLCLLSDFGRARAKDWLDRHVEDIGVRTTVDLRAMFQGE